MKFRQQLCFIALSTVSYQLGERVKDGGHFLIHRITNDNVLLVPINFHGLLLVSHFQIFRKCVQSLKYL